MAVEEVRAELQTIKDGAQGYAAEVEQLAAEERYTSLPARALEVAELATKMAAILDGIYKDAADFNYKVGRLTHATRERLGQVAIRAMEGSDDTDAEYIITTGARSLASALYEPEFYDAGRALRSADAVDMAQKAQRLAGHLETDRRDIETVAPGYAASLGSAIDGYIQRL